MKNLITLVPAVLLVAGCPKPIEKPPEEDPGPEVISCGSPEDCPESQPTCRFGVCVRECQNDAACDLLPGTWCSPQRICEPGCRTSAECTSGKVCQQGSCTEGASCGSKCDCDPGQVCNAGRCEGAPETCTGLEDCPRGPTTPEDACEPYRCDGFSFTCVYDGEAPDCANADDCFGRLGCEAGCSCTPNGDCVGNAACSVATEREDCGVGFFCNADLRCGVLPSCVDETQCVPAGLTCNEGQNLCERPQQCTTPADCTAPTTLCDLDANPPACAVPNCLNGGTTCTVGQACAADGRCVTEGTGGPCINDSACPDDQYCAFIGGTGQCAVGCRDNGDPECGVNEVCNGNHACVAGGSLQPLGGPCDGDSDCQSGLVCSDGSCKESCSAFNGGSCASQGAGCCALSALPCCGLLSGTCWEGLAGNCFD